MRYHFYKEENYRKINKILFKVDTKIRQQSLQIQSFKNGKMEYVWETKGNGKR